MEGITHMAVDWNSAVDLQRLRRHRRFVPRPSLFMAVPSPGDVRPDPGIRAKCLFHANRAAIGLNWETLALANRNGKHEISL